jgi:hypothetical protein
MIFDALNQIWEQVLAFTSLFVMPDWNSVIAMLPILIFVGVIGPFITFTLLGAVIYLLRKPRTKISYVEGPRVAEIGADGEPIFPIGLPYCRRDGLIYPSGAVRCDTCHDELAVICPMCGMGRIAAIDTCTNCGLVLKVRNRSVVVPVSSGPKPGGAAVA